jgi:hypothetical protein
MPSRILAEAKARLGYIPMRTFTQNDPLTDAELDSAPITLGSSSHQVLHVWGRLAIECGRLGPQEGNPTGSLFGSPFHQSAQED